MAATRVRLALACASLACSLAGIALLVLWAFVLDGALVWVLLAEGVNAVAMVLGAVYEQEFHDCSYGFRPGRSAHDALRALNGPLVRGKARWILEADISSYFDSIDRSMLSK